VCLVHIEAAHTPVPIIILNSSLNSNHELLKQQWVRSKHLLLQIDFCQYSRNTSRNVRLRPSICTGGWLYAESYQRLIAPTKPLFVVFGNILATYTCRLFFFTCMVMVTPLGNYGKNKIYIYITLIVALLIKVHQQVGSGQNVLDDSPFWCSASCLYVQLFSTLKSDNESVG